MIEPRPYTEEQLQARMLEVVKLGEALRGPSVIELLSLAAAEDSAELELPGVRARHVENDWLLWGRPKQLIIASPDLPEWYPGERKPWRTALALGGRAMGKSYMGARTSWHRIEHHGAKSLCFVGARWRDVRRVMVGGKPDTDSGFLDILPDYVRLAAEWNKNNQEIVLRTHGATIYLNSAEDEEQRGGNFDWIWGDEPIKWRRLGAILTNLLLSLRRRGTRTQMLLTTTPKPVDWLKDMLMDRRVLTIHGTTHENASNLDPEFIPAMEAQIGGTRVGDQELNALVLGDNDEALVPQSSIDRLRVAEQPDLDEVGVGIDPAVSTKRRNDDSGIVCAGRGIDGELYALEEDSGRYSAEEWPRRAVALAKDWGAAFIIIERNKIGDAGVALLTHALRAADMIDKIALREAYSIKDKWTRAVPVGVLYRQGRAHHVGSLPELETCLTQWDPSSGVSPGTLDAYVHVATELMGLARIDAPKERKQLTGLLEANRRFQQTHDPRATGLHRRGGSGGGRVL
jgi:phage terminase large subunit-like protein